MNGLQNITKSIAAKNKINGESELNERRNELHNKYPNLLYPDITELAKAMITNEYCESCNGQYCEKPFERYIVATYTINNDSARIRYGDCPLKKKLQAKRRRQAGQRYAQIPVRFRNMTANDYIRHSGNAQAVEAAKKVLTDNIGVYIYGAPGVGKSMLASIVGSQALAAGLSVFFADVPTALAAIKMSFSDPNNTAAATVERIIDNDLVILDDLGSERITDWASEQIFRILNARYNNDVPTIVTSNFDLHSLHEQLGGSYIAGRICRRIYDTMTVTPIREEKEAKNVIHI